MAAVGNRWRGQRIVGMRTSLLARWNVRMRTPMKLTTSALPHFRLIGPVIESFRLNAGRGPIVLFPHRYPYDLRPSRYVFHGAYHK